MIDVVDWRLIQPQDWRWLHFKPQELACKDDSSLRVDPDLLDEVEKLRLVAAEPLVVSSCWRTPAYNSQVSSTGPNGPHTTGRALDILCYGDRALRLLKLAGGLRFTGIGLNQKGPQVTRFLHLDLIQPGASPANPRPWLWTY